jgi:hypothetical protein
MLCPDCRLIYLFGIVSSIADTFLLSSALNHRTLTFRTKAMDQRASLHVRKSVKDIFSPAAGRFCISKGSVAA